MSNPRVSRLCSACREVGEHYTHPFQGGFVPLSWCILCEEKRVSYEGNRNGRRERAEVRRRMESRKRVTATARKIKEDRARSRAEADACRAEWERRKAEANRVDPSA